MFYLYQYHQGKKLETIRTKIVCLLGKKKVGRNNQQKERHDIWEKDFVKSSISFTKHEECQVIEIID